MTSASVKNLIFGHYNKHVILQSVNDSEWQTFRISLKGLETEKKIERLKVWIMINRFSRKSKIQVTNYINALKRGGQIK